MYIPQPRHLHVGLPVLHPAARLHHQSPFRKSQRGTSQNQARDMSFRTLEEATPCAEQRGLKNEALLK